MNKTPRPDHQGPHRRQYDKNRQRLLKTEHICAICGQPIDMSLKYPDPGAAVADHIIPVSRGGHPSDIANLQLVHNACNRAKSDKIYEHGIPANAAPATCGIIVNNANIDALINSVWIKDSNGNYDRNTIAAQRLLIHSIAEYCKDWI